MPDKPADFGPIYIETDLSRFPVEPWNTVSNGIFLIVLLVFGWKTRLQWQSHPLLVGGLPILGVGFVGGTVYHATRSHSLWLILDFVPIFVLTIAAALHLWKGVLGSYVRATLAILATTIAPRAIAATLALPFHYQISVGYAGLALAILIPAFLQCRRDHGQGAPLLISATISFVAAVLFRSIDRVGVILLPMGTHFLWHLLGGTSVWCLMEYLFRLDLRRSAP